MLQTASPGSFDLVLSLGLLSAAVIGGLGSLAGAVWGSFVVVFLGSFITDHVDSLGFSATVSARLHDNLAAAIYGLLLVVVIRALPGGIQGLLRSSLALIPAPQHPTTEVGNDRSDKHEAGGGHGRHRAAALVLAGCGASGSGGSAATSDSSHPGVTSSTITLGTTQPLTGPAAPGYSKISAAMTAYFDFVNDNGGINGRKIKLIVEDDGYNPTNTATKTRELVLKDKVFAMVGALGTPTHTAVLDFLKQNKVPGPVRLLGQPQLEPADEVPHHLRLAARLHRRGQDPRWLHQEELPRQEGVQLRPG